MNKITAQIIPGDSAEDGTSRNYAQVTIGGYTVTVYESTLEVGRVVVDVDSDDTEHVAVTVNDTYVHGGPA